MEDAGDRIALAGLADFPLGALVVSPSTARVLSGAEAHRLEPRVMQVLVALARRPGATVTRDELIAACWDGRIVSDDAVARVIAQLRALARDLEPPAFSIETLPKLGFRLMPADGGMSATGAPASTASTLPPSSGELRLAVLPFDNLSGDPAMDRICDGLAEDILHTLAQRAGLAVIGRAASFQFRGAGKDLARVAEALGATHVVDGAVRAGADAVRVTVRLVSCASGETLWSHRADAPLGQAMALQEETAAAAAAALSHAIATAPHAGAVDPRAIDLYLRARTSAERWLGGGDAALLAEATTLAPDFAPAWASLALSLGAQLRGPAQPVEIQALHAEASAAAARALALDPAAPAAHLALALLEPLCGAFEAGDAHIAQALALAPQDPWVLFHAAQSAQSRGRLNEALGYAERAQRAEPYWPQGLVQLASLLEDTGRPDASDAVFDTLRARWPHLDYPPITALYRAADMGRWDRVDVLAQSLRRDGPHGEASAQALRRVAGWRRADPADSLAVIEREQRRIAQTGTMSLNIPRLCQDGHADAAFDLVERASFAHLFEPAGRRVPGDLGLPGLFFARGRAMRADRRFVRLCGKLGLASYWLHTGRWPDCRDEVDYDFAAECRRVAN